MKKRIIMVVILGAFLSIVIYFFTRNDEVTLVSLGDGLSLGMTPYGIEGISFNDYLMSDYKIEKKLKNYLSFFSEERKTVKELIYEIKDNKTVIYKDKRLDIQRVISEADILTLAIGMDELSSVKITRNIKEEFIYQYQELLDLLRKLNQNKIVIISLYAWGNNDFLTIEKINAQLRDMAITRGIIFIDVNKMFMTDEYYLVKNSYYINYLGHHLIYEEIKKRL